MKSTYRVSVEILRAYCADLEIRGGDLPHEFGEGAFWVPLQSVITRMRQTKRSFNIKSVQRLREALIHDGLIESSNASRKKWYEHPGSKKRQQIRMVPIKFEKLLEHGIDVPYTEGETVNATQSGFCDS